MNKKAADSALEVRFWGTRGTLPAPGPQFAKAGGNTNCTAVTIGDHTLVFDAGTGIRELGSFIATECPEQQVHLFLTHAHYDHVEGIPFFAPFFMEGRDVHVYCGELDGSSGTKDTVLNLMRRPYFPVSPDIFTANVHFNDIKAGDCFDISNKIKISTATMTFRCLICGNGFLRLIRNTRLTYMTNFARITRMSVWLSSA